MRGSRKRAAKRVQAGRTQQTEKAEEGAKEKNKSVLARKGEASAAAAAAAASACAEMERRDARGGEVPETRKGWRLPQAPVSLPQVFQTPRERKKEKRTGGEEREDEGEQWWREKAEHFWRDRAGRACGRSVGNVAGTDQGRRRRAARKRSCAVQPQLARTKSNTTHTHATGRERVLRPPRSKRKKIGKEHTKDSNRGALERRRYFGGGEGRTTVTDCSQVGSP